MWLDEIWNEDTDPIPFVYDAIHVVRMARVLREQCVYIHYLEGLLSGTEQKVGNAVCLDIHG